MYGKMFSIKNIVLLLSSVLLVLFIYHEVKAESRMCMGVPLMTQEELDALAVTETPLDNIVQLEGCLTPYDTDGRKIYIPCSVDEGTKFYELDGQLKSLLPEYDLYFLKEDAFDIMSEAVRYSCKFTLYAIDENGNYTTYCVVFTTLPILEMHGECIGVDEREREIYSGELTFWEPKNTENDRLYVWQSNIEWHVRGYSSMSFLKKSLRLSLKEDSGDNNNLSLAGLSSDDDYILNPMWFDDVKVREKLAIDLWNEMAKEKGSTLKMSGGEYCEVIINGSYEGLRLLQNRIEKKYLQLGEEDLLFKGENVNPRDDRCPEEVYEIIYSGDAQNAYRSMDGFFYENDFSTLDSDNWIDLQLLLLLGNMIDNHNYKNIYYVVDRENGEETLSMIPWDTDMSFGVYWVDGVGFRYLPESVEEISYRMEYESLKEADPELEAKMAERWKALRADIFSNENILGKIDEYRNLLERSGALDRDFNILGWYSWGDEDTVEKLKTYIERRVEILDEKYEVQ